MTSVFDTKDPAAVAAAFEKYRNVAEPWAINDSVVICEQFYGNELNVQGWFNTIPQFGQTDRHSFFKNRTAASAGLAYNNQKTQDSLDFVFMAYTWGLRFWSPADDLNVKLAAPNGGTFSFWDPAYLHMWENDLYRHSGVRFKTQQDIRIEANSAMTPAGYGPIGGSIALEDTSEAAGVVSAGDSMLHYNGVSGVPTIKNRWAFENPIALPRQSTIEGELELSDYGRYITALMWGPNNFQLPNSDGTRVEFPGRCGVTMSLIGKRLVQQRGEYHI